uniref:Phosphomevalonate kinase n=1 Tax=Clastoptera arizonana TaxID=38151 RepID=A0A1B6DYF1_9HEMI
METNPLVVLLFSGKRKSGKDTVTDIIFGRLGNEIAVNIKISAPIKLHFAKTKNLQYDEMMSDSTYKEKYRLEMIQWSDNIRSKDFGFFCRAAVDMFHADKKTCMGCE